jgi:hypothetical protein
MRYRTFRLFSLFLFLILGLQLASCGGGGGGGTAPAPLSAGNVNLIFVVSPDLAYQGVGDVNRDTANLTDQGLQRSLLMATYLKQQVLGGSNVTAIYTLAPMTHLQTTNHYPDMAAIGYIQQFALLNQVTIAGTPAYSYPLFAGYPPGFVTPDPFIPSAQGLDFNDAAGNNIALATRIINANVPGLYVFSAPWETISSLMAGIKRSKGYDMNLPGAYMGPNFVYAIFITPSGIASLVTYDGNLNPPSTYPVLPSPVTSASCNVQQTFFSITNQGVPGAAVPANSNINETVYLIRHAEAHPSATFEDGNYVGAGQWRALALPAALQGKIHPDQVYSIDPAQSFSLTADLGVSYVRPSLTVLPYAIANNLPYNLVSSFHIGSATDPAVATATSNFFFTGGTFSNKTILVAWEHEHYPPLITTLLQTYNVQVGVQTPAISWSQTDYDTIWRVTLDAQGNVTVDNGLCEGIDSASLPAMAPQF